MTPLSAFWHKTRRQYVPLTAREWEAKSGVTRGERHQLSSAGLVSGLQTSGDFHDTIYELTAAGVEAHRDSIVGRVA